MERHVTLTRQALGKPITCEACLMAGGISAVLYGGDLAHVGAVSTALPGGKAQTISHPGHKEQYISGPWAERLAERSGVNAAVTCGIHYDGASKADIALIMAAAEDMLQELLAWLDQ